LTVNFARGVSVPANIVEGSSRESKRDYLHFLYIARGSLSETQYFIHWPAGLFSHEEEAADLHMHRTVFACLHGLTKAVEKEAGVVTKIGAALSSMLALCIARVVVPTCT